MARRALLVGIDHYDYTAPLEGCVADVTDLQALLERHEDGTPNYDCRLLTSPGPARVTKRLLRAEWQRLFAFSGDILFYFAGHGAPGPEGGYLVTQDGIETQPGVPMRELLDLANGSPAQEVLLILDCCYSGSLGAAPQSVQESDAHHAYLREGVTLLAASRSTEPAAEVEGHGLFTNLVIDALAGGAADVRGRVSVAAIYAYVEQALGAWDQRPLYRSNASQLAPVRLCTPDVPDHLLRRLLDLFPDPTRPYSMDPSYEFTHPEARQGNVDIFNLFKTYRDGRLLRTVTDADLYFAAVHSTEVALTPLGRFYWQLVKSGRI